MESGEGAGKTYGLFVRPTNGEAAVRLADGNGIALSPDGTQIFAADLEDRHTFRLVPTGTGDARQLQLKTLDRIIGWTWFPDSRHVLLTANEPGRQARAWRLDPASGALEALTAEGGQARVVSPDGRLLPVAVGSDRYVLNLETGVKTPVKVDAKAVAAGFTADSSGLYTFVPDAQGGRLYRLELAWGATTLLRTIRPTDPGFVVMDTPSVSLDGDHFVYSVVSQPSQLFLLKLP
jgi:sugar lactone lactonase YvrE